MNNEYITEIKTTEEERKMFDKIINDLKNTRTFIKLNELYDGHLDFEIEHIDSYLFGDVVYVNVVYRNEEYEYMNCDVWCDYIGFSDNIENDIRISLSRNIFSSYNAIIYYKNHKMRYDN